MNIGENIAKLRVFKKMTQAQLSEKINIHPVTLSNWERGKREPAASDIQRLAEALSCEMGDLLNPPTPPPKERGKKGAVA